MESLLLESRQRILEPETKSAQELTKDAELLQNLLDRLTQDQLKTGQSEVMSVVARLVKGEGDLFHQASIETDSWFK